MPRYPLEFKPAFLEFNEITDRYNKGLITKDEFEAGYKKFVEAGQKLGLNIAMYDESKDRRPSYPEGDNRNRSDFTYGPEHPKWKVMHSVLKPFTIMAINKWHKWISTVWDKDSFVYDDPRMQVLDTMAHDFVNQYFDHQDRKLDFMHKLVDIGLFYMKEDIYYASRFFLMLNSMPLFMLTKEEIENIQFFTKNAHRSLAFPVEEVKSDV